MLPRSSTLTERVNQRTAAEESERVAGDPIASANASAARRIMTSGVRVENSSGESMVSVASPSEVIMVNNPITMTSTPITPGPLARSSTMMTMPHPMTDLRLPPSATNRGVIRPASRDPVPAPPRQ
eukprot:7880841-Karenia_brevis.AAC.1